MIFSPIKAETWCKWHSCLLCRGAADGDTSNASKPVGNFVWASKMLSTHYLVNKIVRFYLVSSSSTITLTSASKKFDFSLLVHDYSWLNPHLCCIIQRRNHMTGAINLIWFEIERLKKGAWVTNGILRTCWSKGYSEFIKERCKRKIQRGTER